MLLTHTQITEWDHPLVNIYKNFYYFLNHIDPSKIQFILNMTDNTFNRIEIKKPIVIISAHAEDLQLEIISKLAQTRTDVEFICLADLNINEYPLPPNVTFFKYRHFHCMLDVFLKNGCNNLIPRVKSKKYIKKFSSLSSYRKQNRAIVTACLLTYAKNDSMISWHNRPCSTYHDYLIDTVKNNSRYADLDWKLLDTVFLVDDWNFVSDNNWLHNLRNNPFNNVYQTSLINFSNESTWFGLHNHEDVLYMRQGPFLTEKTMIPLLAGNILFSCAAPYTYQYLIDDYGISINYSFGLEFDNIPGDLDRFKAICKKIQDLVDVPLTDLIDQNIDNCELIQKTIMDPDYIKIFDQYNRIQDFKILEKLFQII